MLTLTSDVMNASLSSLHADVQIMQRGRQYYQQHRVRDIVFSRNNDEVVCNVHGHSGEYTVAIGIDQGTGTVYYDCDCYYAADHFCKHMVAAALAVIANLKDEANNAKRDPFATARSQSQPMRNWQARLNGVMTQAASGVRVHTPGRYVALALLTRTTYGYYRYGGNNAPLFYMLEPFRIDASQWDLITGSELHSAKEINDFLGANNRWITMGERFSRWEDPAGCLNLGAEAVAFLNILQNVESLYGAGSARLSTYLPLLAKLDIPFFLGGSSPARKDRRLNILPNPVQMEIDMRSDVDQLALQIGYQEGEEFRHIHGEIEVLTNNPYWVLMDDCVAEIRNAQIFPVLSSFPINIPASQADTFREEYYKQIAQVLPFRSGLVHWQDVKADPVPRLYLRDDRNNTLYAELRFGYGEHEVAAQKSGEAFTVETVPDSWDLLRIYRDGEREQNYSRLLADPVHRLKHAGPDYPFGMFVLRAHTHPFDFLMYAIPQLTQAGFEIYGEEDLKLGKINRNTRPHCALTLRRASTGST